MKEVTLFTEFPQRLVFLDVETTGTRAVSDRITEIGAIVYENGEIIRTFKQLINPRVSIPYWITRVTGIDDYSVADAPYFSEIHQELFALLDGAIFVAHNVDFDYSFIREEFRRAGLHYASEHFCTVQLSRNLYPQFKHHGLDKIIERLGVEIENRHRAFDDAEVLVKFFKKAHQDFGEVEVSKVISKILKSKK